MALLSDGTNPLFELILNSHFVNSRDTYLRAISLRVHKPLFCRMILKNHTLKNYCHISQGPMAFNSLRHTGACMHQRWVIGSCNGLSTTDVLSFAPYGTICCDILHKVQRFPFIKGHLEMSSAKWRPFCSCFHMLNEKMNISKMSLI